MEFKRSICPFVSFSKAAFLGAAAARLATLTMPISGAYPGLLRDLPVSIQQ